MAESIFWSFIYRLGESSCDAALTIVVGVVTAGILRRMLTPSGTRTLFGSGVNGLLRGWLAGMLLPVCAIGVIPVAREMKRCGVPTGTVLSFALAAPLLNPISFLYGLTLAEPIVILTFAGFSLLLSTAAGFLWDTVFAGPQNKIETEEQAQRVDQEPVPNEGFRRILAVISTSANGLASRNLLYIVIGLVGTALLSAAIPKGALQNTMHHSDIEAPLLMTALGVPIYSAPLPGMMVIGLMFDHGNSIGAAFVLFALGIGTCLGTIAWLLRELPKRKVVIWFLVYVGLLVALGYASEGFLYDSRKVEIDHTHAFDGYSSPYFSGMSQPMKHTIDKLDEKFGPLEQAGIYSFAGLLLVGLVLSRLDRSGSVERWLTARPASQQSRSKYDVRLPGVVVGGVAIAGLIAFSVVGAYIYYPDRDQCMDWMFTEYANTAIAVRTSTPEEASRNIELWDQIIRKLEVGVFLREFHVTPEQSKTAEDLREALEVVRDYLTDGEPEKAKAAFEDQVQPAYKALKQAYPQAE